MSSRRFGFTFTEEQISELTRRARQAGCDGEDDREIVYQYFCLREGINPVKRGGRREEAIAASIAYQKKKRRLKQKSRQRQT